MCAKTLVFGDSQVNCLEISQDKSLLVAGGNPFIQIFDINGSDDKPILTYDGHTGNVTAVGFQKDLKWLYSGSEDGTLRIWDPRSNNSTRTYDVGAAVNTVALNPNQAELITGDQNGFVKIWDLDQDICREEIQPLPDVPIRSISIVRYFNFQYFLYRLKYNCCSPHPNVHHFTVRHATRPWSLWAPIKVEFSFTDQTHKEHWS
jgi:target of rapamycin complex subunit LST8